jgi:hypothetical protein
MSVQQTYTGQILHCQLENMSIICINNEWEKRGDHGRMVNGFTSIYAVSAFDDQILV